ncbi:PLP-dependent cysteine synthase family protein [Nocardia sp. NPDC059240]|uniref:PLP-dependent cysteine synthase family protein n=1 Tax=Nocardia sp. NPDC059240 TaxID=3346786 RepID=UPI0036882BE2
MVVGDEILAAIGHTPLVRLHQVVPRGCAEILVKVEGRNPTGSMKDRMAQAMIRVAERDGRLKPGATVVECTGGSAGAALALVCAAKGYRLRIVDSVESARRLGREPGTFWTDHLHNTDSITGYHSMGQEIWAQCEGRVDAFVQAVGTAASLRGAASLLRYHRQRRLRVVAVEPAESAVLSGGEPGAHGIAGIGLGYPPPLWDASLVDEVVTVSTADAEAMARRLAREESLCAGISSGANVLAAIRIGSRLGPAARVVTVLADRTVRERTAPVGQTLTP